jgi:hypothetical protein
MTRPTTLRRPSPAFDNTTTQDRLGHRAIPILETVHSTTQWLRENAQISPCRTK